MSKQKLSFQTILSEILSKNQTKTVSFPVDNVLTQKLSTAFNIKIINDQVFSTTQTKDDNSSQKEAQLILAYKILKYYGWSFKFGDLILDLENLPHQKYERNGDNEDTIFQQNFKKVSRQIQLWDATGSLSNFFEDITKLDLAKGSSDDNQSKSNKKSERKSTSHKNQADFSHHPTGPLQFIYLGYIGDLNNGKTTHEIALNYVDPKAPLEPKFLTKSKHECLSEAMHLASVGVLQKNETVLERYSDWLVERWQGGKMNNFTPVRTEPPVTDSQQGGPFSPSLSPKISGSSSLSNSDSSYNSHNLDDKTGNQESCQDPPKFTAPGSQKFGPTNLPMPTLNISIISGPVNKSYKFPFSNRADLSGPFAKQVFSQKIVNLVFVKIAFERELSLLQETENEDKYFYYYILRDFIKHNKIWSKYQKTLTITEPVFEQTLELFSVETTFFAFKIVISAKDKNVAIKNSCQSMLIILNSIKGFESEKIEQVETLLDAN